MNSVIVIVAVNVNRAEILLDDGRVWPIVSWFDNEGEDCTVDDAVAAVAGSDITGWATILLEEFDFNTTVH